MVREGGVLKAVLGYDCEFLSGGAGAVEVSAAGWRWLSLHRTIGTHRLALGVCGGQAARLRRKWLWWHSSATPRRGVWRREL